MFQASSFVNVTRDGQVGASLLSELHTKTIQSFTTIFAGLISSIGYANANDVFILSVARRHT